MKAIMDPLLEPLGMLWFGLAAATVWHLWRRRWRGAWFPGCLTVLLSLAGGFGISERLLMSLEAPYARPVLPPPPSADAIVMLGGNVTVSQHDLFGFQIRESGDRPLTAAELIRQGYAPVLVLGGGPHGPDRRGPTEAEMLLRWFTAWGRTDAPVVALGACLNTYEEAARTRALAQERGWHRIILVTSASHMKRAQAVFRKQGMEVEGVACDFVGHSYWEEARPFSPVPRIGSILALSLYTHEVLGWWVYRARGWL